MKAAVLYAKEDLRYEDVDQPAVKPGTVKVRVRATGICGSDVPRVNGNEAHYYPIILGHEFAGDVVEVGEGVTTLSVGDTVSGAPLLPCMKCEDCRKGNYSLCRHYSFIGSREQGSFAQYVVIPEQNAVKYDKSIPYEQAAMFEPSTVALHGVLCSDFHPGETVAVLGCGTIGIFTIQWIKALGGRKVVAFDINQDRIDFAKKMGADVGINLCADDALAQSGEYTDGRGFPYVFDAVGAEATIKAAFELAANKATICMIGTPHSNIAFTPRQWENVNRKEFKLTGSWMSYSAPFPGKEWALTAEYYASGKIRFSEEFIAQRLPLSKASEAFALFKKGPVSGKVMFIVE